ncbi:MAG: hypothetical protein H7A38_04915 [Chlamydiales bacterium]|nr:hypothetical protein [Chlamydiales bacterium]
MKTHFSKLALGLGAASMFLSASAFAYRDLDDRLDTLEKEMQEISAHNPQGTYGAKFATARPETEGTRWYVALDVLYWHPKMGGTEFAIGYTPQGYISSESIPEVATQHYPRGKVKENDFSWDLGLKVGLGYKTPHDKWDVFARYTWFESHSSNSMHKDAPSAIIPLKINFDATINIFTTDLFKMKFFCNHAKSTVDIDYNNIDLELSRSYFTSKNWSVRPHLDIKATFLSIDQKVQYIQDVNQDISSLFYDLLSPEVKVDLKSKIKGLGPRLGLDTKLYLGNGFNIFADASGSILYSSVKTSQKDVLPNFEFGGLFPERVIELFNEVFDILFGGPSRDLKHKYHRFFPYAHAALGLEWNKYLNQKKQHLSLKMGYEVHYYWRVNQLENVSNVFSEPTITAVDLDNTIQVTVVPHGRHDNVHNSNDLMFYGITGSARLDF